MKEHKPKPPEILGDSGKQLLREVLCQAIWGFTAGLKKALEQNGYGMPSEKSIEEQGSPEMSFREPAKTPGKIQKRPETPMLPYKNLNCNRR